MMLSKFKARILFTGMVLIIVGCSTTQQITLKQDGSATVTARELLEIVKGNFYKSDQISGLYWDKDSFIIYNVKNIDSVGNYLWHNFNKDFFQFKYTGDTLTITDGHGRAFKDSTGFYCWSSVIEITSDRKIKSVHTKNSFVKKRKNAVIINKSKRRFKLKRKNTHVIIVFEK
jgi:hypothetical protein